MKKRLIMFLGFLFLCMGQVYAQTQVKGTIISADDGEPLPGASVKLVGTKSGTTTNIDGLFTITVPNADARLELSHVGMVTRIVKARNGMRIALDTDDFGLDEVMVVAYGTQKKSSFTGAATTIKADKIEKLQVSSISKALEGQVAGVQISSSNGTPGAGASIIVRGIGSISSSQSPLIIMDGVPYEGSLNSIAPQDIESMTVLKDAAANSMYGARGANGVIMITTKSGKRSETKVTFDGRWGFNTRAVGNYDIMKDAGEYYEMMYESYRNSLVGTMGYLGASEAAANGLISDVLKYNIYKGVADNNIIDPTTGRLTSAAANAQQKWDDDWSKDPFKNAFRQEYNVSVSGGNDKTQAYASASYLGDKGYMAGSGFDRFSGRVKVDHKVGQFIKVGANLGYARTDYKTFSDNVGDNYSNIFMFGQNIGPIYPIYLYDQDGNSVYDEQGNRLYDWGDTYGRPYAAQQNPYAVAKENINQTLRDNLTSRAYFEVSFLKDFKFTANVAYDAFNTNQTNFNTPIGGDAQNVGGRGYKYATRTGALNVNEILDWNHNFGDHGVHIMLVHENKKDKDHYMYGHMTNFADWSNPEFSNAALYQDLSSYTSEYALEGYLAKAEYNYLDRYYFTASIRRDGSSRFHKDNRWGTFWAVGGAWRINEEPFMQNVKWINSLKLKASYGTQGNDGIGLAKAYSDLYTVTRLDGGEMAFSKVLRGNKDLKWEKQSMFNVGFEAALFDRLSVNFDFFVKNNKDMLFASPLALSEGAPNSIWRNEVDMRNTGFEFEIGYDIIKTKDIRWNLSINGSHYKNELTRLPDSKPEAEYPQGFARNPYWWKKGGSIYEWQGYEYLGVDEATGRPMYTHYDNVMVDQEKDADGNIIAGTGRATNEIDYSSRKVVYTSSEATMVDLGKSAIPDLTGGISTSFEAYGFDLSIQTAFQLGGYVRDSYYANLMNAGSNGQNMHRDMLNRWTPTNTHTDIPRLSYNSQEASINSSSDYFLTSASFFNLRNITLGYTLPKNLTRKCYIDALRVYVSGDNIWLASKRKGLDPRQSFSGSTSWVYQPLSTYSVGVNITF